MFNDIKLTAEDRDRLNGELIVRKNENTVLKINIEESPELRELFSTKEVKENDIILGLNDKLESMIKEKENPSSTKTKKIKEEEDFDLESLNFLSLEIKNNYFLKVDRAKRYAVAKIMVDTNKTKNPAENPKLFEEYMKLLRQEYEKSLKNKQSSERMKKRLCEVCSNYIIRLCEDILIKKALMESNENLENELKKCDGKIEECNKKIEGLKAEEKNIPSTNNETLIKRFENLKISINKNKDQYKKNVEDKESEITKQIRKQNIDSKKATDNTAKTNQEINDEVEASLDFLTKTLLSYPKDLTPVQSKQKAELELLKIKLEKVKTKFTNYNNFRKSAYDNSLYEAQCAINKYNVLTSKNDYSGIGNVKLIDLVSSDSLNPEVLFEKIYGIEQTKEEGKAK